jgi:hypothetical protein
VARLAAHVRVSAYLARLAAAGIPAHLVHRGDATAGAISVKLAFMDGRASYHTRGLGPSGRLEWVPLVEAGPEAEADAAIARQRRADPDLWVIEVEDPRGRAMREVLDEMEGPDGLAG